MPDTMFAYSKISQQDSESTAQYLVRAKVLLEYIYHMSKLSDISGFVMDNVSLICGLREAHMQRQVTKEQESWRTPGGVLRAYIRSPGLKSGWKYTMSLCMTVYHIGSLRGLMMWVRVSTPKYVLLTGCMVVLILDHILIFILKSHMLPITTSPAGIMEGHCSVMPRTP